MKRGTAVDPVQTLIAGPGTAEKHSQCHKTHLRSEETNQNAMLR